MILAFLGRFKNSIRLGFGFGFIFIFFFATILISMSVTKSVSKSMNDLYHYSYLLNTSILQIDSDILYNQYMLSQASDAEPDVLESMITEINGKNNNIRDNFQIALNSFSGDKTILNNGQKLFDEWVSIQDQILKFALEENILEADELVATTGAEYGQKLNEFTKEIKKIARDEASEFMSEAETKEQNSFRILIITVVTCFIISLFIGYFLTQSILVPINDAVNQANKMKTGDFTGRFDTRLKDEFGELSQALDDTKNSLGKMISGVRDNIDILSSSSFGLTELSGNMSKSAKMTSDKSDAATSIINELEQNFTKISNSIEETSSNTAVVSTATSQMNMTINEIAKNSEKAKTISEEAVLLTEKTTSKMDELRKAAQDIGNVTETITEISEQTNLLALNATIEAARAGEAGKGFAVVANEIKALAKQTADATSDIKLQIDGVQNTTTITAGNIDKIVEVMKEINDIISITATAVEEQSITTGEIAKNIEGTTESILETSGVIADNTNHVKEIASDMVEVSHSASEMTENSNQVNKNALDLKKLAGQLTDEMNRFNI